MRQRAHRLAPRLLREVTFRRLWTGRTISLFGDQVTVLALPLTAILVLHADAAQTGYLTVAALLPTLLFSLAAGSWVDRHGRRRRVMLVADVVRAVLLASVPAAYVFGHLTLAQQPRRWPASSGCSPRRSRACAGSPRRLRPRRWRSRRAAASTPAPRVLRLAHNRTGSRVL